MEFHEEVPDCSPMNHVDHNLSSRPPVFPKHVVMRRMKPSGHASVDLLVDLCADYAFGDSEIEVGLKPEPKLGGDAKVFANRSAVSAVIARFPFTIALMRPGGTAISRASLLMLMPIGFMNSSKRISPGWIGSSSFLCAIDPR